MTRPTAELCVPCVGLDVFLDADLFQRSCQSLPPLEHTLASEPMRAALHS